MSMLARVRRRIPGAARAAAALAGLWALAIWGFPLIIQLLHALNRFGFGKPVGPEGLLSQELWLRRALDEAIRSTSYIVGYRILPSALLFVSIAIPLGVMARVISRARVRADLSDPLERVRNFTRRRPWAARLLASVPGLVALGVFVRHAVLGVLHWGSPSMYGEYADSPVVRSMHTVYAHGMAGFAVLGAIAAYAAFELARVGVRALLAPTVADSTVPGSSSADDRLVFDAVTVTLETRAAVLAMGLLPFAVAGLVALVSPLWPGLDVAPAAIGLYVTLAIAGTLIFRHASRIAVGLDGVLVTGSSPTRFYAYRDLERAECRGAEIRLRTRAGATVRLQPHGEDAARRAAILARIQAGIDGARSKGKTGAGSVVASWSPEELARMADGASDYRAPALTNEQLWDVVEGPQHHGATRAAAAEVLARTRADDARARLEWIAAHSAEPRVRVALARLATELPPAWASQATEATDEDDEFEDDQTVERLPPRRRLMRA